MTTEQQPVTRAELDELRGQVEGLKFALSVVAGAADARRALSQNMHNLSQAMLNEPRLQRLPESAKRALRQAVDDVVARLPL